MTHYLLLTLVIFPPGKFIARDASKRYPEGTPYSSRRSDITLWVHGSLDHPRFPISGSKLRSWGGWRRNRDPYIDECRGYRSITNIRLGHERNKPICIICPAGINSPLTVATNEVIHWMNVEGELCAWRWKRWWCWRYECIREPSYVFSYIYMYMYMYICTYIMYMYGKLENWDLDRITD